MPGDFLTIGRSTSNDMVVGSPYVSGRHCRIVRAGNGFIIEDLGSSGGTFVNGMRVSRQSISYGERVELSSHYRLDWNDPVLRGWMMSVRPVAQAQYPGGYGNLRSRSAFSRVSLLPDWLLTVIGSFFFAFYLIPVYENTFMWDSLKNSFTDGMGFLFIAMAGVAVPVIAYTVRGIGRSISLASIGFSGLILYFVSSGNALSGTPYDNSLVLTVFMILFLCGMMSLNNVVISFPGRSNTRTMAGIIGSVYMALITVSQILSLIELAEMDDGKALAILFSILGYLAHLSVGILMAVNIKSSPDNRRMASLAEKIMLYTLLSQMLAICLAMAVVFGGGDGGWVFFLFFRMSGFVLGLCILLSGGVADIIKSVNI